MATHVLDLQIFNGLIGHSDITLPARPQVSNGVVLFSTSQTEEIIRIFKLPIEYVGSPVLLLDYSMVSATADKVDMECQIVAVTPGDSQDVDAKSYDFVNEVSGGDTVPGTAGHIKQISITLTNVDSWAAGDYVKLKIQRDHDDADNTAVGDLELRLASLQYTDV